MTVTLNDKSLPTRGFFQRNGIIRADQTLQILNAGHYAYDKAVNVGFTYFWFGGAGEGFIDGSGTGSDTNANTTTDLHHINGLYIPTRPKGDGEHLVSLHIFGEVNVEAQVTFQLSGATITVTSSSSTRWTKADQSIDFVGAGLESDIITGLIASPDGEEAFGLVITDTWLGTSNIP